MSVSLGVALNLVLLFDLVRVSPPGRLYRGIPITIPGCKKRLFFSENILPFSGNNYVSYSSHSEKSKNDAHYNGRKKFQHMIRETFSDY